LPVIVTRTLPGARDTADTLARLGYTPTLSPMLAIEETGLDASDLAGVRHIVFTSANGVRALHGAPRDPDLIAWCVGPSTAEAAREAGFGAIIESDGNADDLARRILAARPDGPLLHIANEAAAGNLVSALIAGGLDARFCAPYRTQAAASLSAEALAALASGTPVILLLHSAKAATAVAASRPVLDRAGLVAISEAALSPLKGRAGRGEWIAARPNEDSLMDALREAAAALCP
jgi:uroporphyrinogen-III synthase